VKAQERFAEAILTGKRADRMQIGVIADDLTGAMDTGAQFSGCGLQTVLQLKEDYSLSSTVAVVNTSSREVTEQEARSRVQKAVEALQGCLLYKKIDSTLRGHLAVEIQAILQRSRYRKALVCPVVVEEKRWIVDGQLWINGQPLHRTAFASDPVWPARSAAVEDRLREPTAHFPLRKFKGDSGQLRDQLLASPERILVPDARSKADLNDIVEAIRDTDILPCGALSLAQAWISASTGCKKRALIHHPRIPRPLLYVVGSRHPSTREQAARLVNTGKVVDILVHSDEAKQLNTTIHKIERGVTQNKSVLLHTSSELLQAPQKKALMLNGLRYLVRHCVQAEYFGGYVAAGGETASLVLSALSAAAISIQGEISAGFPFGIIEGGGAQGLPIFTKAGGFGLPDCFTRLLGYISD
jgi:uncharacterized protein YgbK (DUF1537 family)